MSKEQQSQLDTILRQGRLDTAADVASVRAAFNALMAQVPVPAEVQVTSSGERASMPSDYENHRRTWT
jgi:hypothetical protein